jgi:hypothetical protein
MVVGDSATTESFIWRSHSGGAEVGCGGLISAGGMVMAEATGRGVQAAP